MKYSTYFLNGQILTAYGYFRYNPWATDEWLPPFKDFYECISRVKGLSKIYYDEEYSHEYLLHLLKNIIQPFDGLVILNLNDLGYKPEVVLERLETIMNRGIYLFDVDKEINVAIKAISVLIKGR